MSAEAIKKAKAKETLDEAKKSRKEAVEELEKAIEVENEAASKYPIASLNLSWDISEIISASYSPRNL